jgi:hypothetical protein
MKNRKIIFLSAFLLTFSLLKEANAQLTFELNTNNYYDDNIYNNYYKVDDFVNGITFGSGYDINGGNNNFQIYYMGNYNYFQKNILKSNYTNKIGIVNTTLFSENGNPLNLGANLILRKNRSYFSIYDFNQLSFYANYNHSFVEGNYLLFVYFFSKNDYYNLSLFSHYENKIFTRATFSFETKTTLMLGSELNFKSYLQKYDESSMTNKNSQLALYLNLSQSLSENTGVALYTLGRINLQKGTRFTGDENFIYYEEELLNSIYSSESMEYGLSFTQIINDYLSFNSEIIYRTRNFSSLPAADSEGNSLDFMRNDEEFAAGIGLEYNLGNLMEGLVLIINYNHIKNKSNDFFYDYNNEMFLVGFGWGY